MESCNSPLRTCNKTVQPHMWHPDLSGSYTLRPSFLTFQVRFVTASEETTGIQGNSSALESRVWPVETPVMPVAAVGLWLCRDRDGLERLSPRAL
jgi:hypothetical protein